MEGGSLLCCHTTSADVFEGLRSFGWEIEEERGGGGRRKGESERRRREVGEIERREGTNGGDWEAARLHSEITKFHHQTLNRGLGRRRGRGEITLLGVKIYYLYSKLARLWN